MRKLSLKELHRIDVETFKSSEKAPIICVLDNIRSQHNVGSIFRTCDAFRIKELYLCGITATPPSREIEKSALGATDSVNWKYFLNTLEAVTQLLSEGYRVIAVEQTIESVDLREIPINKNEKIALIFGNEVEGVSQEVLDIISESVEIQQFGTKHSFNVSVVAGIVLFHFFSNI